MAMALKISLLLFFFFLFPGSLAQLQFNFYRRSCPQAGLIIRQIVANRFSRDPSVAAALLRMQFHDCFVTGCDASLLIDPTPGSPSEKNAGANRGVRGFDIIDEIKSRLEVVCPGTVSCSDILALATRDAVVFAGGPLYLLQTGRRDSLVSNPNQVNLPGPNIPVPQAFQFFQSKGMALVDFVALLGGHTIGFTHCNFFQGRLSDGTMDPALAARLSRTCAVPTNPSVFLDQGTPTRFDNEFYRQILRRRGVLKLDHDLAFHALTRRLVLQFAANHLLFRQRFARAMVKMANLDVLTGTNGQVRRSCRAFN